MPRNETVMVIGQLDILDHSHSINLCKDLYIGGPEGSLKHAYSRCVQSIFLGLLMRGKWFLQNHSTCLLSNQQNKGLLLLNEQSN